MIVAYHLIHFKSNSFLIWSMIIGDMLCVFVPYAARSHAIQLLWKMCMMLRIIYKKITENRIREWATTSKHTHRDYKHSNAYEIYTCEHYWNRWFMDSNVIVIVIILICYGRPGFWRNIIQHTIVFTRCDDNNNNDLHVRAVAVWSFMSHTN